MTQDDELLMCIGANGIVTTPHRGRIGRELRRVLVDVEPAGRQAAMLVLLLVQRAVPLNDDGFELPSP